MVKKFHENLLLQEMRSFARKTIGELIEFGIKAEVNDESINLLLNDKEITKCEDIKTSNGRYYFRKDKIWERCYIPCTGYPGVYFFFNQNSIALYIGKSETSIGKRVAKHVGTFKNGTFPKLSFPEAEYVIVIPFEKGPFLAPAFESYLLSRYSFKYNTAGQ
jgi:GIY-YIG catalytic domain